MSLDTIQSLCERFLDSDSLEALAAFRAKAEEKGAAFLEVHFASLPRRFGREFLNADAAEVASGVRLCSMRTCDLVSADILARHEDLDLFKLYEQGDALERRMILKALNFLPDGETSVRLLQEAHRTNDEEIFRAAYADTALPARILEADDFNRGVLKCAFMDVEYDRLLDVEKRATAELSDMLLEFMSEREAAGRKVWAGSLELAAHAPTVAVKGKIAGGLQHGRDDLRLHSVRGAALLLKDDDGMLRELLTHQLKKERNDEVKSLIESVL